jgi:NAD(P)-dependent dehydrogenase (short-subunit alcohol dehydrogenase family)
VSNEARHRDIAALLARGVVRVKKPPLVAKAIDSQLLDGKAQPTNQPSQAESAQAIEASHEMADSVAPLQCAIYTRKSTEEGLDQQFNSLDAQREAAEAYIRSQKCEGWEIAYDRYDDGGFSGGNIERPALKRLMEDIQAGKIDRVVVYKVDRLSRSLLDFARVMETFDKFHVSFVSVTQHFNTTHSMGRLTLNILLAFAQFEPASKSGLDAITGVLAKELASRGIRVNSVNGNLLTGPDTKFGPDSLTIAKTTFRKQKVGPGNKAKDQKPINIRPEFLVVPVEIETDAELLMGSAQLMMDAQGTPTKIPVDNPHRNKYRVISTPHLSDSYYQGASGSAWYLFANPNVLPAFEIVFLNGRRTPVIERVEMPANTLGMGFRSYIDFGVNSQDPRAAVKVTGE